ncbi:c-type cytochrome [Parendozoicomonas haliclonae]
MAMTSPLSHAQSNPENSGNREQQLQLVQMKGCASCHGTKGQGNPSMKGPKLAGQNKAELIAKLKAYRAGERNNPTMAMMAYNLSDEDINTLAEYFSQFQ